jgi:hypothetical protein
MTKYLVVGLVVMSSLSGGLRERAGKSQTQHPGGHDQEYAAAG